MRVLICGAGRVGQGIARRLAKERHDVVVIDEDATLVDQVATELDVRGVVGHAAHPTVLRSAGAADCEMIVAVTYYDEVNMVICEIAHTLFKVTTKIARVRAQPYLDNRATLFGKDGLPIDRVISPEIAVGEAVLQRFDTPGALMSWSFAHDRVKLVSIELSDDSPVIDTSVDQIAGLFPDLQARIVGVGRGKSVFTPSASTNLAAGDRVYAAVQSGDANRLIEIFNRSVSDLKQVVIVGGGNTGLYVAKRLEKRKDVRARLIEIDPAAAERAAMALKRTIVIRGDGLDPRKLEEAGAGAADFVITLTNDDKSNLLIGSLAKRAGAARAISLVNTPQLEPLARDLHIDLTLDPRALTVSEILLNMRKGRILSLQLIEDGQAEAAEGIALGTSPLIGKTLDYGDLPDGIAAAAVIRDDDVLFPNDKLTVKAEDHVIVFFQQSMTRKVEQLFRVSADFF